MAMLSELLRFDVVDSSANRTRLFDLGSELLDHDYPPVTNLYVSVNDKLIRLPWSEVETFDKAGKAILVRDLKAGEPADEKDRKGDVLLKRDVLDALIVDLLKRRTTRVSDLQLLPDGKDLRLHAADAGFKAMLRRMTRGRYRGIRRGDLFDWKYVEFLRGDPQAVDSGAGYHMRIGRLSGGEISQIADYLPYLHAAELLTLLPNEKAAQTLQAMGLERQIQIIEEFDENEAIVLLSLMSPDLATDLIASLEIQTMKHYLGLIPKKQRERIIRLLQYPSDSAGGLMINNIVCFGGATLVDAAREKLKTHARDMDFISIIFVTETDSNSPLTGAVSLRTLLEADKDVQLSEIMDPYVTTLNPFDQSQEAAYKLLGTQVAAMPVTCADGLLLGAVTIDAAIGQMVSAGSGLSALKVFS
jgi:magnesium transporter